MKELRFESEIQVPLNTIINYQFGIYVNNSFEYLDYGNYIVFESKFNVDTGYYEHICYDKMLYSMKEYKQLQHGEFPMTVRNFIKNLCLDLSLTFADSNSTFANYNKVIESDLYKDLGYTYRDIFDELSAVTGSIICLKNNDQVEIRYINETDDTITSDFLKDTNITIEEHYGPINSIVLSRSAESDNVFIQDEQSIVTNGLCEIKIKDNQIMNFNNRSDYLPDLLEKLGGLNYYVVDLNTIGIGYYEVFDKYNLQINENTYNCILFNSEFVNSMGINEQIYSEKLEESQTDYSKSDKTDRKIKQAYLIVDKQNQKIEALVSTINGSVKSVQVQYALSTSSTTAPSSGWSTTAPAWQDGKYMWQRTITTYADNTTSTSNPTNITGAKGQQGAKGDTGKGVSALKPQYYLSNSNTSQTGGAWVDTCPEWSDNKYIWTRTMITWTDNTTTYTTPTLANDINGTNKRITDLNLDLDGIKGRVEATENGIAEIKTTTDELEGNNTLTTKEAVETNALKYHVDGNSYQENEPTPTNPSEIETIKPIFNLFDKDTMIITNMMISSNKIAASTDYSIAYMPVEYGKSYRLSFKTTQSVTTNCIYGYTNEYPVVNTSVNGQTTISVPNLLNQIFTPNENNKYLVIRFRNVAELPYIKDIQLEEGTLVHSYVPFGKWHKEIKITGKNLIKSFNNQTLNGIILTNNHDGSYTLNGTATARTVFRQELNLIGGINRTLSAKINQSIASNSLLVSTRNSSFSQVKNLTMSNTSLAKITNNSEDYYFDITIVNGLTLNNLVLYIQLEEGNNATEIVSHKEQSTLIDMSKYDDEGNVIGYYELAKITEKDTLDIDDNTIINQKIGKHVFTGNENWQSTGSYAWLVLGNNKLSTPVLSNYFKQGNSSTPETIWCGNNLAITYGSNITNLTTLKSFLQTQYNNGTPVTVYYELETPQTIELPNTNIPLFEGVNHVTLIDDLETNTSIKYLLKTPLSDTYQTHTESKAELELTKNSILLGVEEKYSTKDEVDTKIGEINVTTSGISSIVSENQALSQQRYNELSNNFDNYALAGDLIEVNRSVQTLQTSTYTKTEVNTKLSDGSVTKVSTTSGTFDKDGLHIAKSGEEMESLLSNTGLYVNRTSTNILTADNTGVTAENLHSRRYLSVGGHCRWEDFEDGVGAFYVE